MNSNETYQEKVTVDKQKNDYMEMLLNFEAIDAETIALEPECINRAIQLSSKIQSEEQQWQTYLNALALFGFEQWLSDRAPEIPVNPEKCSIFQPQKTNLLDTVCNLKVGDFQLCLMAMGSLTVEAIPIPREAIDLPELIANFYVVVEVREELEQAIIIGFVSYEQLLSHLQDKETLNAMHLPAELHSNYQIPLTCFERDVDNLLLNLRCLQPEVKDQPVRTVAHMLKPLTQSMVNVGLWSQDKIDEFARGLSWVLLPALSPAAVPMRSPTQELEAILNTLERTGTQIPPQARGAYQDLELVSSSNFQGMLNRVRLYAVTWLLPLDNVPEWTLLLILGAPQGYNMPHGTMLRVRDDMNVLVERTLNRETNDSYLYACVAGTWSETFLVTISLPNGATVTLPPFAFRPERR